uniref:Uncharacterized protein n=1 Tax=Fundulus heteroclitus TaxID=8078 RepID=A0A3Q2T8J0_FUNHE
IVCLIYQKLTQNSEVQQIERSAYSPDLKIIEDLWDRLRYAGNAELASTTKLVEAWDTIPQLFRANNFKNVSCQKLMNQNVPFLQFVTFFLLLLYCYT